MDDRKLIKEVAPCDIEEITGPIDTFIDSLQAFKLGLEEKGWCKLEIKIFHGWDWTEIKVVGMRPETDEEYDKRKKAEQAKAKRREKKLEKERATYERLKEKFGE